MIEKDERKKLMIVFYESDGQSAKDRAHELRRQGQRDEGLGFDVRVYQVDGWNGEPVRVEGVVIMRDVVEWKRQRIERAFHGLVLEGAPASEPQPGVVEISGVHLGTGAVKVDYDDKPALTVVQGARGKWYVDNEDGVHQDGPFESKNAAEAKRREMLSGG